MTLGEFRKITADLPDETEIIRSDYTEGVGEVLKVTEIEFKRIEGEPPIHLSRALVAFDAKQVSDVDKENANAIGV